ncbi:unnamed protein product [Penicillium salamii]|nr:unnamed protein product [Penicillium salamii]CAG7977167.1 unnamed protein product [Penicillium salamii]CAG8280767.1 unnamed protein product [Penicillium salamii]
MIPTPFEKERLTRITHSKVRTGCLTCRSRHIKCDEGRPVCALCRKSGLECEYRQTLDRRTRASRMARNSAVEATQVAPISHELTPRVLARQVDLTWKERYFLDFFRRSTSLTCAGYLYDEFWERLVHQASEDYPAIRHAVIGMGCLSYHFTQSGSRQMRLMSGQPLLVDPFPLQQINKAIVSLQQNLSNKNTGRLQVEAALIACVVLVSTLLFQEDSALAGRHLWSGYMLLDQYLTKNGDKSLIAATITRAFAGIHLVWSLFTGTGSQTEEPLPLLVPEAFEDVKDEIQKSNDLLVTMARISSRQSWFKGFNPNPTPDLDIDQNLFMNQVTSMPGLIQSHRALHANQLATPRYLSSLALLELWASILALVGNVESGPEPRDMAYDGYTEQFAHILEVAKETLSYDTLAPTFSVNIGITAPLGLVILKCRDWAIRREAIALLRRSRRQEGIWSTDFVASVTERFTQIESKGLGPGDVIPESSRVKSIRLDSMPAQCQVRIWYHFVRDCPGYDCQHVEPWEYELLSYASGSLEVLEASRDM